MSRHRDLRDKKPSKERMYEILRAPIITEKATLLSEFNQVSFWVPTDANKFEIKHAIEGVFEVTVRRLIRFCKRELRISEAELDDGQIAKKQSLP